MQATLHLPLITGLVCYVLGAPPALYRSQDKLDIDTTALSSIKDIIQDLVRTNVANAYLGLFPEVAASSCKEIAEKKSNYQSGYYWIRGPAGPMGVYCEMDSPFQQDGGWMRVASVDMTQTNSQCPQGLYLNITQNKRTCGRGQTFENGGCSSTVFPVNDVSYKKVCGKVIGYQSRTTYGFGPSRFTPLINETYVDGVSITHGSEYQHLWTFASTFGENVEDIAQQHGQVMCPCIDFSRTFEGVIPSFVKNDYFCETGNRGSNHDTQNTELFTDDPLWDGEGCEGNNMCCDRGGPWFCKELEYTTSDDIELRVCTNAPRAKEDILLQEIELYVQ